MKQAIKDFFIEHNYAKFLALCLAFMWLACFMALATLPGPLVLGCSLTSLAFGLLSIFSGVKQYG